MSWYAVGAAAVTIIGGLLDSSSSSKTAKKQQRLANETLGRILPVQQKQFDYRYGLSEVLNNLLLTTEENRYNQVGGAEVALRGNVGDESVKRFDEQAAAVDEQVAGNRTDAGTLIDELGAALTAARGATAAERGRQKLLQTTADTAALALPGQLGAVSDAVRRGAAKDVRLTAATDAIGAADTGGFAPMTKSRVMTEFARRGQEAQTAALGKAGADAEVGAYADSQSAGDRTIMAFNNLVDTLGAKATASRAALPAELAAAAATAKSADTRFQGKSALTNLVASGKRDVADRYRTGRISAISDAGESDINSMAELFSRLSDSYRTGYGGQMSASERYESMFSDLMRQKAAQIMGQPGGSNGTGAMLQGIGSLMSSFNFGGSGGGSGSGKTTTNNPGAV